MIVNKAIETLETKLKSLEVEIRIWKHNPEIITMIKDEIADHETALKILNQSNKP